MRTLDSSVLALAAGAALFGVSPTVFAFNSGSTGADGALVPTVDTVVQLPASGILNYTRINIPTNVKVTFRKNITNTPVVLLVAEDATISGTLDVSGANAAPGAASGDGVLADDGDPGDGGPGGYAGGRGGKLGASDSPERNGGKGLGPGGGKGGLRCTLTNTPTPEPSIGGAGGGFGTTGEASGPCGGNYPPPTPTYGSAELLPLIGGSGGGGGRATAQWNATGGGGGGGALLLAVTGTLSITGDRQQAGPFGKILASGGAGGDISPPGCTSPDDRVPSGGGGSGGAIRLVATTIAGNGELTAAAGARGTGTCNFTAGRGGDGRIRLEAENITRTTFSTPQHSFGQPGALFISGSTTLSITSVAGTAVPQPPRGIADVRLPAATTNPVTVAFASTGIPVGNTVQLSVVPSSGQEVTAVSTALSGSTANATASASVNLPTGASTLQASVSYTVVVAIGEALAPFAQGERVERISVTATLDGKSTTRLITVSGREFDAPPEAMRIAALGG